MLVSKSKQVKIKNRYLTFCRVHGFKLLAGFVILFLMNYVANFFIDKNSITEYIIPRNNWKIPSIKIEEYNLERNLLLVKSRENENKVNKINYEGNNSLTLVNDVISNHTLIPNLSNSNSSNSSYIILNNSIYSNSSASLKNTSSKKIDIFKLNNDKKTGNKIYSSDKNKTLRYNASFNKLYNNETSLKLCPLIPPKLVGRLKVLLSCPTFDELENIFPDLKPGGRYWPPDCKSRNKVAIIIPYRDREEHLRIFLHNINFILQRQQIDYGIYIIEESGNSKFNRAKLLNIGFVEALKQYDYECFIFHDIDLIPEDDRNLYTCPEQPRHMSVAIDIMSYKLPYKSIFGGVSALTKGQMEKVNGFSNEFWGWGGEDDDMSNRINHYGLKISRYSPNIARYKMLKHKKDVPNPERYKKLYRGKLRYPFDGLKNLKYKRIDIIFKKLFTWVLVDLLPPK